LVDRDDALRLLHAGDVLKCAAYSHGKVDLGFDGLARRPDLPGLGEPYLVDDRSRAGEDGLEECRKLLVAGYLLLAPDAPAHGEQEIGLGNIHSPPLLLHVFHERPALDRGDAVDHLSRRRLCQEARMLLEAAAPHGDGEEVLSRPELPEDLVRVIALGE